MTLLSILDELGLLATAVDTADLDFEWTHTSESRRQINAVEHSGLCDEYMVTVEKDGYKWVVYAEEHEPEDLEAMGFKATHKTLRDATKAACEFARFFQDTEWQNVRDNDPE
jgi:hypothetical protein